MRKTRLLFLLAGLTVLASCETINLSSKKKSAEPKPKPKPESQSPLSSNLNSYESRMVDDVMKRNAESREQTHKKVFGF